MNKIVVINPGATSTKLAFFQDDKQVWKDEIIYTVDDLQSFNRVYDQFDLRLKDIEQCLEKHEVTHDLDTVVGRGGLIGPVKPGAIIVDDLLVDRLENHPVLEHASNLGCKLAKSVLQKFGKPNTLAYVYDPVTVDSMSSVARMTGLVNVERKSIGHHLNMRAVAMRAAKDIGKTYQTANIVVVHLGGGSSASAHQKGTVIDFVSDDEIMFSAERSGGLPIKEIIPILREVSVDEFNIMVRKEAGLQAHCGTKDLREIEARIVSGDTQAALVVEALALGVSKCIASLSATLNGEVDAICLTGGMAYSERICQLVESRVTFIAPLKIYPGEFELQALAEGGLRVLTEQEQASFLED